MDLLTKDLRFALRMIRNSPGFTAIAIMTLALGIGADTAIFSFVNAVLLKPLPFPHAERILNVWEKPPGGERNGISTLNFLDWKNQNTAFTAMAAQAWGSVTLTSADVPVQLRNGRVSAPYFDIFGAKPILGRTFVPGEDQPGNQYEVVLSHRDRGDAARDLRPRMAGFVDAARLRTQGNDAGLSLDDFLGPIEVGSDFGAGARANEGYCGAHRARLSPVQQGMERHRGPVPGPGGGRQLEKITPGAAGSGRRRVANRLRQPGQSAARAGRRP